MIKLEHLRVFLVVVDSQSISTASERISRTPSAVSMTLKQLEETLGGPLFLGERKTRLTPLGMYVADKARRVVREHDSAVTDILHYARGEEGIVRVAVVPSVATAILPTVVEGFRERYKVRLEIRDIDSASVAAAVTSGTVDFGIASKTEASKELAAKHLVSDRLHAVCPHGHPLSQLDRPVRWSDLFDYPFIANGLCAQFDAPEVAELVQRATLFLYNVTTLHTFIGEGFGISLLPGLSVPGTEALAAKPLEDASAVRHLFLFRRPDDVLSPSADAFSSAILHSIAENKTHLQ